MNIKLLTLKTNHTLLGDVEETPISYTIKKPVQVINIPPRNAGDQGGIAFSSFVEYAEEFTSGFSISKDDVLFSSTPVVELINQYNQIFGSGIQIASSVSKLQ